MVNSLEITSAYRVFLFNRPEILLKANHIPITSVGKQTKPTITNKSHKICTQVLYTDFVLLSGNTWYLAPRTLTGT